MDFTQPGPRPSIDEDSLFSISSDGVVVYHRCPDCSMTWSTQESEKDA